MTMYLHRDMMRISRNLVVAVDLTSHWPAFSVSDMCQLRRHNPALNNTTGHKPALPKLLNNMAFNPSLKRVSYETLTLVS